MKPLLQLKSNDYYTIWVCICSLRYPGCNARAPYFHLWPVPLYNIFPHYLISGKIFRKNLLNTNCVFWFSLRCVSENFVIPRRNERGMNTNVCLSSCEVPFILFRSSWNLNFLNRFSKFPPNIKFHENPSSGSRIFPCGRTDMTKLIVVFRNFANKPPKKGKFSQSRLDAMLAE